jgi:molybdate-binding protein
MEARLGPTLDTMASELSAGIDALQGLGRPRLRLCASHGYAVQAFADALSTQGIAHTLRYCTSAEAIDALRQGQCDWAGIHIPVGTLARPFAHAVLQGLDPAGHHVIHLALRRQGLMTQAGNPLKIYQLRDLLRPEVRFLNRPLGSGTRRLLDALLADARIRPSSVSGYERCEATHAAVAAGIASGQADAALGLELPARTFGLEFLPLQLERYVFIGRNDGTPAAASAAQALLLSAGLQKTLHALPGYTAEETGRVQSLGLFLESLGGYRPTAKA